MTVVDSFYVWLQKFLGTNALNKIFFILLDVLIILFCLAIILFFAANYASAYRATAKIVMKAIQKGVTEEAINIEMKKMPYTTRSLWHRFRKERRGKPSDYLSISECLQIPTRTSWNNCFAITLMLLSIIFASIIFGFEETLSAKRNAVMMIAVGCFFAAILVIMERASLNATLLTHEKLVLALNKKSKEFLIPSGVTVPEEQRMILEEIKNSPEKLNQVQNTISTQNPSAVLRVAPHKAMGIETQNLLLRIDGAIKAKAPASTLRQLAAALQKEKVKPENQLPERQQRLNRAMNYLLKAISESQK
ncbi:MAG TPA: hypothetical protein VIL26_03400 [Clostridia bacterium]